MVQYRDKWWALVNVNVVIKHQYLCNLGNLVASFSSECSS